MQIDYSDTRFIITILKTVLEMCVLKVDTVSCGRVDCLLHVYTLLAMQSHWFEL